MKKIVFTNKIFMFAILTGMLVSCGGGDKSSQKSSQNQSENKSTVVISEQMKAEAEQVFTTTCAACHGKTGKGDGAVSKALVPPPRDLTSAEWQNSVDDAHIAQIIQHGGGAVGKSLAMPSNPAIGANKKLLEALVAYIRSLKE